MPPRNENSLYHNKNNGKKFETLGLITVANISKEFQADHKIIKQARFKTVVPTTCKYFEKKPTINEFQSKVLLQWQIEKCALP